MCFLVENWLRNLPHFPRSKTFQVLSLGTMWFLLAFFSPNHSVNRISLSRKPVARHVASNLSIVQKCPPSRSRRLPICKKAPLCKGRDALSKQHGVLFIAKAGSKLCLRPGPKAGTAGDWGIVVDITVLDWHSHMPSFRNQSISRCYAGIWPLKKAKTMLVCRLQKCTKWCKHKNTIQITFAFLNLYSIVHPRQYAALGGYVF